MGNIMMMKKIIMIIINLNQNFNFLNLLFYKIRFNNNILGLIFLYILKLVYAFAYIKKGPHILREGGAYIRMIKKRKPYFYI